MKTFKNMKTLFKISTEVKELKSGFNLGLEIVGVEKGRLVWSDKAGTDDIVLNKCSRCGNYDFGVAFTNLCNVCIDD